MARKKELEENEDRKSNYHQQHQHHNLGPGGGKKQNFLGGGTKNKEFRHSNNTGEAYDGAVGKQLSTLGLMVREMPGDGNCLFRALSDQITGSSRNHLEYRRAVVQYMKEFRADFEPFVEDDVPFDKYIQRLAAPGTFAGNDAIVAFARLHNVSVVIHQLNSPAWVIHPSKDSQQHDGGREVHIFYHNGDHYNSVRKVGDDSENPTNICLHVQTANSKVGFPNNGKKSPSHTAGSYSSNTTSSSVSYSAGAYESKRDEDYWVKDAADIERLVEEVMQQTNYLDANFVRETLLDYNFDVVATIDYLISISVMLNQSQCHSEIASGVNTKLMEHGLSNEDSVSISTHNGQDISHASAVVSGELGKTEDLLPPKIPTQECLKTLEATSVEQPDDPTTPSSSGGESDDTSPGSPSSTSSRSKEHPKENEKPSLKKEVPLKRSNRHKREIKRKERKREADRRRMLASSSCGAEKENTVVISHLGSLDI